MQGLANWTNRESTQVVGQDRESARKEAGGLFRLMDETRKQQLFTNIAGSIGAVPDDIKRRQLDHFHKADPAYAAGVARAIAFAYEEPDAGA